MDVNANAAKQQISWFIGASAFRRKLVDAHAEARDGE